MILVTGSSGFIGHALIDSFGKKAIGLRRSLDNTAQSNEYLCDITDTGDVKRVASKLDRYSFTHLIHTAAVTPWSSKPDFRLDASMAESVLWLCEELHIPYLYFISGWNVYSPKSPTPFTEETPLNPTDDYGKSKNNVEEILTSHSGYTQIVNLRLASVYGPGQMSKGLIPNLVGAALNGDDIYIDATNVERDYLYIDDLIRSIHALTEGSKTRETYLNIGSGASYSVISVAKTTQSICKRLYDIDIKIHRREVSNPPVLLNNKLDITKARSMGLLRNNTPLLKGLEAYIKWRKNENLL